MTPAPQGADVRRDDTPNDGYGAGFLEYSIRTSFRDLCRILGKPQARQIIDEIINDEFERKHHG